MSSILTNNSAMVALETLRGINRNLEMVQAEISTGKKVSNAKDNAAIWAISTVMSTDVESFKQINDSLNKGLSSVGVARNASEQITGMLQDMRNLIVSAQDDLNADDRARIQTDIDSLRTTITNVVNGAQLNGQNLLKGTDNVTVLASIDRAADGSVSTSNITVTRNDLSQTQAADAAAKVSGDAGFVSTSDSATSSTVAITSGNAGFLATSQSGDIGDGNNADITITAGTVAAGDEFTVNVGGNDYTYTASADDNANDIANGLEALITAAGITNLTASVTEGTDPASDDATLNLAAAGGDVTFDESALAANTTESVISDGDTVSVSIAGGTIDVGDTFTINVGGSDYTYTAVDGDTVNSVATGLETLINDASISNLTVAVTEATDPSSDAATIALTADGGDVDANLAGLASQNAAVTAGGLADLANLSVSTAEDATTALNTIETLLDTAISASASFGSSQKSIETQSEFVQTLVDSMTSGIGALVDADLEAASAKLQALQVQQQLGIQALSIANQSPQTLLALFR